MTNPAPAEKELPELVQRLVAILENKKPGEVVYLPGWVNSDLLYEAKKHLGLKTGRRRETLAKSRAKGHAKKGHRHNMTCSACRGKGHRKLDRECPLYGQ